MVRTTGAHITLTRQNDKLQRHFYW
jgi:hypothetical protein